MNNEISKATFNIDTFKIVSFSINEPKNINDKFSIKFTPSGKINENTGSFELTFLFEAKEDGQDNAVISAKLVAWFSFNKPLSKTEIPNYFYKNSIAIVFPYLRSFISTLTIQANFKMIILPLLNLSNLEIPFKEATVICNE